jgi:transposase
MTSVGIDLHKHSITLCIWNPGGPSKIHRMPCANAAAIRLFFAGLGPFQASIEATASYHWLVALLEPLAQRIVLAHPKKMRIIAESRNKSDRVDARILAEFLANDWTPGAYRPTPRQREHRTLVRHRQCLIREQTLIRNKIRRIVSDDNADRRDLFSKRGLAYLATVPLNTSERFVVDQLLVLLLKVHEQLLALKRKIQEFAAAASAREARHRTVLRSIPGVGEVTSEVVLAELGDEGRFRSAKQVAAYAGLAPGRRESAGKARDLSITKQGSGLLRWVLVEAAWQIVRRSVHWHHIFSALARRRGRRRAIVAVARRLLGVLVALLRSGQEYQEPRPPDLTTA